MNRESSQNKDTFTFKTNINCGGCVAKVTPALNNAEGICHWEVDTDNRDKILTVQSEGISREIVIDEVKKVGFSIEVIK